MTGLLSCSYRRDNYYKQLTVHLNNHEAHTKQETYSSCNLNRFSLFACTVRRSQLYEIWESQNDVNLTIVKQHFTHKCIIYITLCLKDGIIFLLQKSTVFRITQVHAFQVTQARGDIVYEAVRTWRNLKLNGKKRYSSDQLKIFWSGLNRKNLLVQLRFR